MNGRFGKFIELGHACSKIGSGVTPRGGDATYIEEGVALIRSQNIYNSEFSVGGLAFIDNQQADSMVGVTVEKGDVLLNITGDSVARACVVPESALPARVNQHVAIIRTDRAKIDSRFLMYYLVSPYMQAFMLSVAGSGGTRKALTKAMIENFQVPDLPIDEQRKIADTLSAYDDLIENNRRRIQLLEESARLLYQEWFVHLRFPGHEHVKLTAGVPEGWQVGQVEDFFDTSSGGTPTRTKPEYFEGHIPWVKTQELHGRFVVDTEEKITDAAVENSSAKIFPRNTVLLSIYGGENIGRTGILDTPAACNQACAAIFPKHNDTSFLFLHQHFQYRRSELVSLAQGVAQTNISQQVILGLPFVMPSKSLLISFSEILLPIYEQIRILQKQNAKLTRARDLLLPRLMSGELVA